MLWKQSELQVATKMYFSRVQRVFCDHTCLRMMEEILGLVNLLLRMSGRIFPAS
jgi:hypothetical protein